MLSVSLLKLEFDKRHENSTAKSFEKNASFIDKFQKTTIEKSRKK